jgi:formate dehydrogenase subunit gamma
VTAPSRRIVRYVFRERVMHALAALSYVYLLLTGLAFWTPGLYWIAIVLGGGYLSRVWHPWIGLLFTGALVWMFITWRREMRITPEDRAWGRAMGHYIRNEDDKVPAAWRFNFGQKQLFWLMWWCGIALLVSGVALWFVASIPWEWRMLRYAATLVHAIAALLTIGAFIIHLYMGLAVVPGGFGVITRGDVTEEWAAEHHALWLGQVRRGATPAARSATGEAALSDDRARQ